MSYPRGVLGEYAMTPFEVKLSYIGKPWCTVQLKVGFDEIGNAGRAGRVELSEASEPLGEMGLPALGEAPLMGLEYKVAQKFHGLSSGDDRVRDLVDLQLIARGPDIDFAETRRVCTRLFAYRKQQAWPPKIVAGAQLGRSLCRVDGGSASRAGSCRGY